MSVPAIRCQQLKKLYPPDVWAVQGIDLEVRQGECFGLLGPNGAGKTTTIEILEGLLEPTSGTVEIFGQDWGSDPHRLRQQIGISLQETRLQEKLTVVETVRIFRSFYHDGLEPEEAVRLVGLEEKSKTWVMKLSGGQKKRLEIACALAGKPRLLFLDEPTTGLDPQARRQLWEIVRTLRSQGRTILVTTHYMDEAEKLCDRVAIVDRGRIITLGSPAQLIASLGADHMIEFALEATEGADPDCYTSLPGVRAVQGENGDLSLTVSEPHVTIPALLDALRQQGHKLQRLTTRHASLDDVFMKLTGRHFDHEEG